MSTFVVVNTYTHSVTYVTDKLLLSLKEIIRGSGLSPEKLTKDWDLNERAVSTWLHSRDLETIILEVFNPRNGALVGRWDFDIIYGSTGDGGMWVDTDDIHYHIKKAGLWPSECDYTIMMITKPGRPDVAGWGKGNFRDTEGFIRQTMGTTIDGDGLRAVGSYWRKVP